MSAIDALEKQMNQMMSMIIMRVLRENGVDESRDDIVRMKMSPTVLTVDFEKMRYEIDRKTETVLSATAREEPKVVIH